MVVVECRTDHLAARMIWTKVFWENIHFGRVVLLYGVTRIIVHFVKESIPRSIAIILFILFSYHPGWNLTNSSPKQQRRSLFSLLSWVMSESNYSIFTSSAWKLWPPSSAHPDLAAQVRVEEEHTQWRHRWVHSGRHAHSSGTLEHGCVMHIPQVL